MILFVIGTRPEAIKMCPIILEFKKNKHDFKVCLTGQHGEMVNEILKLFDVKWDFNFSIMKPAQSLTYVITSIIDRMNELLNMHQFEFVFVHGDTTTAMAAAICAFQNKVKIIHIESGLRTTDLHSPFPEESNRRIISTLADISFCPTAITFNNLECENNKSKKYIVGNSVIDAINYVIKIFKLSDSKNKDYILLTTHRRENIGENMVSIFKAINYISLKYKIDIIFPIHPNPTIRKIFESQEFNNSHIKLIDPLDYVGFTKLLLNAKIIVTDSGGIQEEASHLGKPILVLRDETERIEAIENGNAILVGHSYENIIHQISLLLDNNTQLNSFKEKKSPYGDGKTSEYIYTIFKNMQCK